MKGLKRVRIGDTVIINGITHKFGTTSSESFNKWLGGGEPDCWPEIYLFTEDRKGGGSFFPSKIKEALEGK